jgi:hypothetical protein
VHPSSILRAPDDVGREHAYRDFVADLRAATEWLAKPNLADAPRAPHGKGRIR